MMEICHCSLGTEPDPSMLESLNRAGLRSQDDKSFTCSGPGIRVGGNSWQKTEFRLVCATNRNLFEEQLKDRFRRDFYYRIASWTCHLPALSERREDILVLARHFISQLRPDEPPELDDAVRQYLLEREYPGNVRDLKQLVTRMTQHHVGPGAITVGDIPELERPCGGRADYRYEAELESAVRSAVTLGASLKEIERAAGLLAEKIVIDEEQGNLQRAALVRPGAGPWFDLLVTCRMAKPQFSESYMTKGNDWNKHKLRGRVKFLHSEVANLSESSGRWNEETHRPLNTIAFNENGCVVKELQYDLDGHLSVIGFTKYDANGKKSEVTFQNPRGGLRSSLVYEYDEAGKLLGCVSTQADGLISKQRSRATYDQAGNKTDELWRYEDGTLSRRYVYKYGPDGELAELLLYTYDDDGSIEQKRSSIYDERENVIESACFNEDDRPIEERTEWKYNDDGEVIEVATFNLKGDLYSTTSYSYDVDAQRNWTKRLEIYKTAKSGFETRVITYRTLEYY